MLSSSLWLQFLWSQVIIGCSFSALKFSLAAVSVLSSSHWLLFQCSQVLIGCCLSALKFSLAAISELSSSHWLQFILQFSLVAVPEFSYFHWSLSEYPHHEIAGNIWLKRCRNDHIATSRQLEPRETIIINATFSHVFYSKTLKKFGCKIGVSFQWLYVVK